MLELLETEEQYESYIKRIYILMKMDLKEDSEESEELKFLSILVQNYEQVHCKLEAEFDKIKSVKSLKN
ncbi:hypothetical protein LUD75_07410 [Epilithonimonas sp. JDS]|uniref:hypothetical protein n=1 Tax=Epilithonimonas sp. JDS TaxID=2902797 RepID=UPI001E5B9539|nr:hypothetical protein [Epilithonimonas sp. JDS]MCD9854528.1 hypothetical protein [Epilithonimonas sp. JDS]